MAGARGRCPWRADGELVEAEQAGPKGRMGLPRRASSSGWAIPARRGRQPDRDPPARHPDAFPDAVIAEADAARTRGLGGARGPARPAAVTIDPPMRATMTMPSAPMPMTIPKNPGGHVIWVAIADVAHYVRPGSALDREARKRGNSTYFPDRVVPMLPDRCRAICAACTRACRAPASPCAW
jgi:ribonuclease R